MAKRYEGYSTTDLSDITNALNNIFFSSRLFCSLFSMDAYVKGFQEK